MKPLDCCSERQMILGYQGAEGLGEGCSTLKKNHHAHAPEVTREKLRFTYTGRLERHSRRDSAVECPLPLPGLSYSRTGTKQKVCVCNKRDAARHSLLVFSTLNELRKPKGSGGGALPTTSGVYISHWKLQKFQQLIEGPDKEPCNARAKQNRWAPLAKERWKVYSTILTHRKTVGGLLLWCNGWTLF